MINQLSKNILKVEIEHSDPPELKTQLARAISAAAKWYLHCDDGIISQQDKDDLCTLLELQKQLI